MNISQQLVEQYTTYIKCGDCSREQFSIRIKCVLITQELDGEDEPEQYVIFKDRVTDQEWIDFTNLIRDLK